MFPETKIQNVNNLIKELHVIFVLLSSALYKLFHMAYFFLYFSRQNNSQLLPCKTLTGLHCDCRCKINLKLQK